MFAYVNIPEGMKTVQFVFPSRLLSVRLNIYKKVLLRERKRHTARPISSTPSAVLSRVGGTPSLVGYPTSGWGGYTIARWGYPISGWGTIFLDGVPHLWIGSLDGGT